MKKISLIFLVVLLSISSLLISVEKYAVDIDYYILSYENNKIEDVTGKSKNELISITEGLIEYLKGNSGEEALRPHYNNREVLHMEDVQVLFQYGYKLKYISLLLSLFIIIFLIVKKEKRLMGEYVFKGLFINWVLVALLLLMISFDFNKYFNYFHLIFFSNDLWILDPSKDLLIQMLPQVFFIDIAKKIGLSFLANVAILQVIGYIFVKKGEKRNDEENKKEYGIPYK